jgi:hypothetical protein
MREIGMAGACSHYEEIELEELTARLHDLSIHVDSRHLCEQDLCVRLASQKVSNGPCYIRWGKGGRGDLIEQRLEAMVIAAVEERYLGWCVAKRHRGRQSAKATAHYHNLGEIRAQSIGPTR